MGNNRNCSNGLKNKNLDVNKNLTNKRKSQIIQLPDNQEIRGKPERVGKEIKSKQEQDDWQNLILSMVQEVTDIVQNISEWMRQNQEKFQTEISVQVQEVTGNRPKGRRRGPRSEKGIQWKNSGDQEKVQRRK